MSLSIQHLEYFTIFFDVPHSLQDLSSPTRDGICAPSSGTEARSPNYWTTREVPNPLLKADNEMEKAMAPHSSTLAWKIPWTEEPGRLQSMGL